MVGFPAAIGRCAGAGQFARFDIRRVSDPVGPVGHPVAKSSRHTYCAAAPIVHQHDCYSGETGNHRSELGAAGRFGGLAELPGPKPLLRWRCLAPVEIDWVDSWAENRRHYQKYLLAAVGSLAVEDLVDCCCYPQKNLYSHWIE